MGHSRIQELDDIKSSLVLIMLVFHSASGLTRHAETLAPICSALFFIHYAFLMVTGLLCGIHYGAEAHRCPASQTPLVEPRRQAAGAIPRY